LRILQVIPGLGNSSGPTHVVVGLSEHLARQGCAVTLYCLKYDGDDRVLPDPAWVSTSRFAATLVKRWGYSQGLKEALKANLRNFDIAHVHSVWLYPTFAAARECRRQGVPYLIRPAGSFRPVAFSTNCTLKRLYFQLWERWNLENAAAIHATSEPEAAELRALGIGTPICVVPIGVTLPATDRKTTADDMRRRWGIEPEEKIVLYLGRLHPIKGLDILVAAFARLNSGGSRAKLVIVGPATSGYDRELKMRVRKAGLEEKCLITGELRGDDKRAAYEAASVFVLPSRTENFGIVVAEAMAMGTPVVISREAPWLDVESHNAGSWVDLDAEKFAAAIADILENPDMAAQMGENGRRLVETKYTWDRIAKRMLKVYENVVAGKDPNYGLGDPEAPNARDNRVPLESPC